MVNVTGETQSAENIFFIENLLVDYHDKKLKIAKTFKNQFGHASALKLKKSVKSSSSGVCKKDPSRFYVKTTLYVMLLH